MAVIGIDYGSKRIGVAVSLDGERPQRRAILTNDEGLNKALRAAVIEIGANTLVVGLPRNLDGEDTAQTALVRKFALELESSLGIDVVLQDEADTSNLARERLEHQGMRGDELSAALDSEAAVIILEDYLGA